LLQAKPVCLSHRLVQLRGVLGKAHPFDNKYFRALGLILMDQGRRNYPVPFDHCAEPGHN
jgi:hypothetical protein